MGLGFIGVLSVLSMELPIPAEHKAILQEQFSPQQIKLLLLINPTIMLTIAIITGMVLYQKVNLELPLIERLVGVKEQVNLPSIAKHGIGGGILAGILLVFISLLFIPSLPMEFVELGESLKPSLAARFLYGGLTEEILMRFGLMTLIVWIVHKIFGNLKPIVYWIGIAIASIIFALGHFPIAFQAVEEPSTMLLCYLLIGNGIGGLIFGWLYWKKGLESSFLAHIFAHVVLVISEPFLPL